MSTLIPSGGRQVENRSVQDGSWWPALSVAACRTLTGLGEEWSTDRIAHALTTAAIKINLRLADWKASQGASSLAAIPSDTIDGKSQKVILYESLVYYTVRSEHLGTVRDYDSTKAGHDRADALEPVADVWRQLAAEAEAALLERRRMTVELI